MYCRRVDCSVSDSVECRDSVSVSAHSLGLVSNSDPRNFRSIHLGLGLGPNLVDRKLGGPEPDTSALSLTLVWFLAGGLVVDRRCRRI